MTLILESFATSAVCVLLGWLTVELIRTIADCRHRRRQRDRRIERERLQELRIKFSK